MAEEIYTRRPEGADRIVLDYLSRDRGELPHRNKLRIVLPGGYGGELDKETYATVRSALGLLQTARNEQIRAVHKRVAQQLNLTWPANTTTGYIDARSRNANGDAIYDYSVRVPISMASNLAMAEALELGKAGSLLWRRARGAGMSGTSPRSQVVPALFERARLAAEMYTRPLRENGKVAPDELALGFWGAYLRAWHHNGEHRDFTGRVAEIYEAEGQAVDDVRERVLGDPRYRKSHPDAVIHRYIGAAASQILGFRLGGLLGRPPAPEFDAVELPRQRHDGMLPGDYYVVSDPVANSR